MTISKIRQYSTMLENHSLLVTNTIQSIDDLRIFMEHHVYAVWDFMSLAKSLQHSICPSGNIWLPSRIQRTSSRLINEIILSEESDIDPFNNTAISHFDLYCQAMSEIGADTAPIMEFLNTVKKVGITRALEISPIPEPSRKFIKTTFDIISKENPHEIAAAFTHGRETVIPQMFRRLVNQLDLQNLDVSRFLYYLERHIEIDGDDHGPASIKIITELCDYDPIKISEAEQAAIKSIQARIEFWNEVELKIINND